jgi:hypothetical protein
MATVQDKYGRTVTYTVGATNTTITFTGMSIVVPNAQANTTAKILAFAEPHGDPEIETGNSGVDDPSAIHMPLATSTTPGLVKIGSGLTITNGVISATGGGGGGGGGSSLTYSSSVPDSPSSGDRWMNADTGIEFVYINDGTSSQWVNPIMTIGLDGIQYNPTLVTLDITGNNTYGKGFRIAKSSAGNDSRVAGLQMGVSSTATDNTFLYNNIGTFTIYNGSDPTGTSLLSMSTSVSTFGTPVSFGNNEVRNSLLKKYSEVTASPTISSGTLTVDLSAANVFTVSLNADITTLTISNTLATSNTSTGFTLVLTADGTARTITWPASVKWSGGTAPTLTSTNNKIDVLSFVSYDQGTSWLGFVGGQNF